MKRLSPAFLLVSLHMILFSCVSLSTAEFTTQLKRDESSLVAFKSLITSDPRNMIKSNWTSATSVCTWRGVTCDSSYSRVTELDISYMDIQATIPIQIANLSYLESLDLRANSLHGSLPNHFCSHNQLQRLKVLHLSRNKLEGEIPLSLGQCPLLEKLDLSTNNFSGSVPAQIGNITQLKVLNLGNNSLTGIIPVDIYGLEKLQDLDLSLNKLWGGLAPDIGNMSSLESVFLPSTGLSGALPSEIWHLKALQGLNLEGNAFYGSLPRNMCMHNTLQSLRVLVLSFNNLEGDIPISLGECPSLTSVDLSNNNFGSSAGSSSILSTIGNLTMLWYLDLSFNRLNGLIPFSIGNSANRMPLLINLSSNKLNGELPNSICNMTNIQYLLLSHNNLEGTIPPCFGNLSNMWILHLNANHFSGLIPLTFTKWNRLVSINLNGNKLQGPLPKSLINCQGLEGFDVGNNEIQDEFPFWMDSLPSLRVLVLRSNKFHGTMLLPSQTELPFPQLQVLDVSENAFIGSLPERYLNNFRGMIEVNISAPQRSTPTYQGFVEIIIRLKGQDQLLRRLLQALTTLDLSSNGFFGSIPPSIGNLKSLKYLNLSYNTLTGHIPSSLGSMSALESLDLASNKLDGEIPNELTKLSFLSKLNLSMNQLDGPIPIANQFSTFENDSYMGNSGLCGDPFTRKCTEENQKPMPPQEEGDDGGESEFIDGFSWQSVALGYGSGFAVGIGIGCCIIHYGEPRWLVEIFFGARYDMKRRTRALATPTSRQRRS